MSTRKLFAILLALAVLLGPVSTYASAASAAAPSHHGQMIEAGHCEAPPADSTEDDAALAKICCVSTCMAIAITPSRSATGNELGPAPRVFAVPALHLSYLGEIATPPPRSS